MALFADSPRTVLRRAPGGSTTTVTVSIVVIAIILIAIACGLYFHSRRAQRSRQTNVKSKHASWRASLASFSSTFQRGPPVREDVRNSAYMPAGQGAAYDLEPGQGVDRNTSVRSVITLPAYSAHPRENDTVIAREGDRAGMDTVVEFPETAEEEEDRRENEMDSLYQIRRLRRQEAAEREERRRMRREARARGDFATVIALREEAMRATAQRDEEGSAARILEHETRPRGRKVSAINYGDLGVARHDGSRVRANSNESGRPLLETAQSFGMSGPSRPWVSREDMGSHRRTGSSATNLSVWTYDSDDHSATSDADSDFDVVDLQPGRSRANSQQRSIRSARAISGTRSRPTSMSQNLVVQTDLGEARIPEPEPPSYDVMDFEEAPAYMSPVRAREGVPAVFISSAETNTTSPETLQTSTIPRLPSIRINRNTTPDQSTSDLPDFSSYSIST